MAPALRIPARLDMNEFRQNVAEARSKVQDATDFMVRQLEKTAAKSAVFDLPRLIHDNDTARAITQKTVQAISQDLGRMTASGISILPKAIEQTARQAQLLGPVFSTVLFPAAKGFAEALLPIALRAAAIYGAFVVVRDVVAAITRELELMVAVADKAQSRGLSAETFQAFVAAAKGAKDVIDTLEAALDTFFQANKRRVDDSVSPLATDAEKEKWTDLARAIREVRFEMDGISQGPRTFLNAGADMNKQLLGVVQTLRELKAAGQDLVAFDIAEKAFGSRLADNLRTGKLTIEEIADTVEKKLQSGVREGSIFSNQTVQRAKEIDDQLKEAWRTVDKNLHPSMEALDNVALNIKNAWVDIVKLIAEGAKILAGLTTIASSQNQEYVQLNNTLTTINTKLRDQGLTAQQRRGLEEQQRAVLSRMAVVDLRAGNLDASPPVSLGNSEGVPLPQRRPIDIPATDTKDDKGTNRDRFDSSADAIEKRTAALEAETASIDLNTQAREKAKITAELETVAKQANSAAGLGENVITAEQRQRIDEVAEAYGRAALAIERARSPLATFARESQNVEKSLNQLGASTLDALSSNLIVFGNNTQTVAERFRNMANSILNDLARIALRQAILGPVASGFNGILSGIFGGGSSVLSGSSPLGQGGIGHNAEGTDNWRGGPTWVGEEGPEVLNLPKGSRVTPNAVATRGMGGPTILVTVVNSPTFAPGMTGTDLAAVNGLIQQNSAQLRNQVQEDLRTAIRNDADTLTRG